MHWTLCLMIVLVAWAYSGTYWKPASGVLAILWTVGQIYYLSTGQSVPLELYWATDFLLLGALLLWPMGVSEVIIACALVFQIDCYINLSGAQQWWCLWVLTAIQMTAAGPWKQAAKVGTYIYARARNRSPRNSLQHNAITVPGKF